MSITEEYESRLAEWSDIQGHMPFLRECAAKAQVVIELGTRSGQSTSAFLAGLADSGGELWSVDKDDAEVPAHWHDFPNWHFLRAGDDSNDAMQWLPLRCDVLFIDTDHTLNHMRRELELYVPRVRLGGLVLLHDTEWEDPAVQLDHPTGEVAQALTAFCEDRGLKWENRPGSYGLGVVRL